MSTIIKLKANLKLCSECCCNDSLDFKYLSM